jgi:OTU domain-containing protein 5
VGARIDAVDSVDVWCEAEVTEVEPDRIRVHFLFWDPKWDVWVERAQWPSAVAPTGSHAFVGGGAPLRVGQRVDCFDMHPNSNAWLEASIVGIGPRGVKMHYKGYKAEIFDEWIPSQSKRIAPFGHVSKRDNADYERLFARRPLRQKSSRSRVRIIQAGGARWEHYLRGLQERRWRLVEVQGDGACLFRSISHQVYGTEDHHAIVRAMCLDYMVTERAFYMNFIADDFDEYIATKRLPHEFGDDPEIQACCEIYNRPAHLWQYDEDGGARLSPSSIQRVDGGAPMLLSYYGGGHYDSITSSDSAQHHLRTEPGVHERTQVNLAAMRVAQEGRQDNAFNRALQESRIAWDQGVCENAAQDDIERALAASWASVGGGGGGGGDAGEGKEGGSGGGGMQSDVDAALAQSQREREAAEEAEMQRALALSGGGGGGGGAGGDAALNAAIMASQMQQSSDAFMDEAKRRSLQGLGGGQAQGQGSSFDTNSVDVEVAQMEQLRKEAEDAQVAQALAASMGGGGGMGGGMDTEAAQLAQLRKEAEDAQFAQAMAASMGGGDGMDMVDVDQKERNS